MNRKTLIAACTFAAAGMIASALPSHAYRMIYNTTVGRVSAGSAVSCSNAGGVAPRNKKNIVWRFNTAGQGLGKSAALTSALAVWTNVASADHVLSLAGTTTTGWATNGVNTVLWA